MKNNKKADKYFMYCRKSSDSDDRQVQSIDAQKRELKGVAKENNLNVADILTESASAKEPGRPVFNTMIKRIKDGEADGLLVWKVNRLARNARDGGMVKWLLQEGIIKHIKTFSGSHYPEDNAVVLSVEMGMSAQYSRDLSTDTKRGLRERYERGYPNGQAPIGYKNDLSKKPGNRGWKVDEDRFPLVKKLLKLYLTGDHSVSSLKKIANDKFNLTTPERKNKGGKKISRSYIHHMLQNPVYAGFFLVNGSKRYELNPKVPTMITEEEYNKIQDILSDKNRSRTSSLEKSFPYKEGGRMICGYCGGVVSAERKSQVICSNCNKKFSRISKDKCPSCGTEISKMEDPTFLDYKYYHCTKNKDSECPSPYIREEKINEKVSTFLENNLEISSSLREWCIKNVKQLEKDKRQRTKKQKDKWEEELKEKEEEYDRLLRMQLKEDFDMDKDDFNRLKNEIKSEKNTVKSKLKELESNSDNVEKKLEKTLDIATKISNIFKKGTSEEKKEVLSKTASNLTVKKDEIQISSQNHFSILLEALSAVKDENPSFEPQNNTPFNGKTEVEASACPTLLRGQDSNL